MSGGRVVLVWALLTTSAAQVIRATDISAQGPIAGIVLDERLGALRPIYGFPGATILGAPLPLDFHVLKAAISPDGSFALVLGAHAPTRLYVVRRNQESLSTALQVELNLPEIDGLLLAADGTAAIAYSKSNSMLQVIHGLPGQAAVLEPTALPAALGRLTTVAVDAHADTALVSLAGETVGGAFVLSLNQGPSPALTPIGASFVAAAVTANPSGGFVAAGEGGVYSIDLSGQASLLYGPSGGASAPVAICGDTASRFAVINGQTKVVGFWSATPDSEPALLDLDWTPDRCQSLGGNRYLLNGPGRAPMQILDLAQSPRVLLTPADNPEVQ